ncbi:MAG: DUF4143 domain-containing protein [Bacilli bacterium]
MSLFESLDSTGEYSIKGLFNGTFSQGAISTKNIEDYSFLTCRRGWPKSVGQRKEIALDIANNYYDSLINNDFYGLEESKKNSDKMKSVLRSYTRNTATKCSIQTIVSDSYQQDSQSISDITVSSYLNWLRNIYVIEDIPAWNPNLRSKIAIRTSPTRHFVDPSIACSSLGL